MARAAERLPENAPGDYFVDSSCIDCAICREVAPSVFRAGPGDRSYVFRQPDQSSRLRAAMALVACPTSSIGTSDKALVREAAHAFPDPIEDEVSFAGYASEHSYGAQSYFIARDRGNVLVDSPRFVPALVERLEALGGVAIMFLTHRDDVADHAKFAAHFGCERILHARDASGELARIERTIDGDDPLAIDDDLLVIPVPGHTRGSAALLYRDRFLFSGDHVWASEDLRELEASRSVCWYSWAAQTRSMERLASHRFDRVLPGHGRRFVAASPAAMKREIERLAAAMAAR
jgi:glyoxylase-like metal-dependent hydrolase (beta-lactamase superfamily II)/ferredoxin